jgi:hypothetical protein
MKNIEKSQADAKINEFKEQVKQAGGKVVPEGIDKDGTLKLKVVMPDKVKQDLDTMILNEYTKAATKELKYSIGKTDLSLIKDRVMLGDSKSPTSVIEPLIKKVYAGTATVTEYNEVLKTIPELAGFKAQMTSGGKIELAADDASPLTQQRIKELLERAKELGVGVTWDKMLNPTWTKEVTPIEQSNREAKARRDAEQLKVPKLAKRIADSSRTAESAAEITASIKDQVGTANLEFTTEKEMYKKVLDNLDITEAKRLLVKSALLGM